jgi:hypothetical protein
MLMKKLFFSISFLLLGFTINAQTNYPVFLDQDTKLKPEDSGRLSLHIDNLNYLRNYEYFGDIPLSYTLLGYQFIPQLKYQLNENFLIKGGIFLRHESGRPGFEPIQPIFTAKYQKKDLSLILGTLEGAANHRFIEPIYNIEATISDRIENGVQVKLDKPKLFLDWYIDWEKSIKLYDPFREEFTSGISSRFKLIDKEKFGFEIPAQAMVAHKGGQISTSSVNVESLLNTAVGASLKFKRPNGSFLKEIQTEHYFVYYRNLSGTKARLYNEGVGTLSTLTFKSSKNFDLDLRFWNGWDYFGPRGQPLYNSISEKIPNYGERSRQLIFLTFIYDKQLFNNVSLDLRMEPYYDIGNNILEYGYSAFIRFNKDFFLKKIK